jgi:RHS repeat-associated protein
MEGQLVPYQQTGTLPFPTSVFTGEAAANGFLYDAAGNVFNDNVNTYLYDGEGRICAVMSAPAPGMRFMTGYLYDADGTRVAKGTITSMSCDPAVNGFQTTSDYVLGLSDEQVTEMGVNANGTLAHQHTNVWAGGKLLGTYDDDGLHFYLDDPLGTRRVQTDYAGVIEQQCASFPFGDGETCTATPTEHLFTGKERDTESGNDYFGARYYASGMGRFMSPDSIANDWELAKPQTWNRYVYARNNPIMFIDPDGAQVQLIGDEKQRQKELEELQKDVGNKEAAARLYIKEVKDGDKTNYFVGIKDGPTDFKSLSSAAADLGNLVGDKQTVEFGITDRDLTRWGGAVTFAKGEDGGQNQNVRILVNPNEIGETSYFFRYTPLGQSRFGSPSSGIQPLTMGITTWHEFGHGWGYIHGRVGGASNDEAITWENRMRQQVYGPLGPKNTPRKIE